MARRDRGMGFGEGFRGGMSVVRDLTALYVQTSEIFEDRAQRQVAQQVGLEVQKQIETIQAPVKMLEQKIADYTSAISKGEQPGDEMVARKLLADLEEARGLAATQKFDIANNAIAGNLGNPHVEESMKLIGMSALQEHQLLMQRAHQADQIADARAQREHEATMQGEQYLDREALTNLEYDRRAQEAETEQGYALERIAKTAEAQASVRGDDPYERFFKINQTVDAEMKSKPATWYEKEGRKQNMSGQDYFERVRAERISDMLDADEGISDALKDAIRPTWSAPERDNPIATKAQQIRTLQEELYAAGDTERADALEDDALRYESLVNEPLSEDAERIEEESWIGTLRSIEEKLSYLNPAYMASKGSEAYNKWSERQSEAQARIAERRKQREALAGVPSTEAE